MAAVSVQYRSTRSLYGRSIDMTGLGSANYHTRVCEGAGESYHHGDIHGDIHDVQEKVCGE